jgi:hypothetical protein
MHKAQQNAAVDRKIRNSLRFSLIFGLAFLGSIGSTIFLSLKYDVPYTDCRAAAGTSALSDWKGER